MNEPVVRDAPGRVNLIGEHTDYNDGFVLPIATPQRTTVTLTPRDDRRALVQSASMPEGERDAEFVVGEERRAGRWFDYVQGVTQAMRQRGWQLRGFHAFIETGVPLGSGLSSSASLEIAIVRALDAAFQLGIDPIEAAHIGHRAETDFVGAPVGIMDQMAASLATTDAALFLDTRSLAFERVPIPGTAELLVVDSGIVHSHAGGEYRVRRAECEEAARRLGVRALRDVAADDPRIDRLPDPLNRRTRHVVTENARVLLVRDAFLRRDAPAAGAAMNASHASMRDDFNVSTPEIDTLVRIAQSSADVFGARLTGGGFGGAIVALVRKGRARAEGDAVVRAYAAEVERRASVLIA